MIYTKGKAGYHMEKSDILTASLPDANDETTDHSTIFDDVFRTIAQKMPQLLIPLINEVFHTSYSEEEHFEQLRNEHYEKYGTVILLSGLAITFIIWNASPRKTKRWLYECSSMIFRLRSSTLLMKMTKSGKLNFHSPAFSISVTTAISRTITKRS